MARAHGEFARIEIINGDLRAQRHQHKTDQAHIVVERQPGHHAVVAIHFKSVSDNRFEVGQCRAVLDDDAAREARTSGSVLNVGNIVGSDFRQRLLGGWQGMKCVWHGNHAHVEVFAGFLQEWEVPLRGDTDNSIAGLEQLLQLGNVCAVSAHFHGGRQGYRYQPRILAGIEKADKIGIGFCYQGDTVAFFHAQPQQFVGQLDGFEAQFAVGHAGIDGAAPRVEVGSGVALSGIIQRFGQSGEISRAKGQLVLGRRGIYSNLCQSRYLVFDDLSVGAKLRKKSCSTSQKSTG